LPGDDLTQPMKEIGARLAFDAGQIRRRHPSDEKLRQSILRLFPQTTAAYPHSLILDPLWIWDSPNSFPPQIPFRTPLSVVLAVSTRAMDFFNTLLDQMFA
jgi:hypothetical protein